MEDEIKAAVAWWHCKVRPLTTPRLAECFAATLAAALPKHLRKNGWQRASRGDPAFGHERRMIGRQKGVAVPLLIACRAAGFPPALLPEETLMFIDPGFVAVAHHETREGVAWTTPLEVVWKA